MFALDWKRTIINYFYVGITCYAAFMQACLECKTRDKLYYKDNYKFNYRTIEIHGKICIVFEYRPICLSRNGRCWQCYQFVFLSLNLLNFLLSNFRAAPCTMQCFPLYLLTGRIWCLYVIASKSFGIVFLHNCLTFL